MQHHLFQGVLKPGLINLSFNTEHLNSGQYFVIIKSNNEIIKSEKIIVL